MASLIQFTRFKAVNHAEYTAMHRTLVGGSSCKGASIKDVPSKSGLFDNLPTLSSYDVIVTFEVALLCPLRAYPGLDGTPFLDGPQG